MKDRSSQGQISAGQKSGGRISGRSARKDMRSWSGNRLRNACLGAAAILIAVLPIAAQQSTPSSPQPPTPGAPSGNEKSHSDDKSKPPTHITPEQAQQLFALVDELIKFSSDETGLPIKSKVKRQLTTRAAVESYLNEKFNEDQDAKRLQRDEIVLKKFGLLDRDFALKSFLLALLKEQIEAYYDSKTKTVNLLDWVDVDEQKPVLAHELTHALQDQHADLEKWDDQTPDDVSTDSAGDSEHLRRDEMDTARDAVAEGQATAVMMDYILKPMGKSLIKDPEVMEILKEHMNGTEDSPVMARAPLLLSESMLFPYREGLSFEQDVWMDQGQAAAFSGALDRPPSSTWEIINPRLYEQHKTPPIPLMPDIHPVVDQLYQPYDIGQVGQLDVHIMSELFGGDEAARNLTPAWNGGIYWAGRLRSAGDRPSDQSTKSLAIFYLAAWRNPETAEAFAKLYANSLGRKYSGLKEDEGSERAAPSDGASIEQVFTTSEGPVVITTRGKFVFIAESFPLEVARKLTTLILGAQGTGELKMAHTDRLPSRPQLLHASMAGSGAGVIEPQPLSASLVRFFGSAGVLKAAVDGAVHTAK